MDIVKTRATIEFYAERDRRHRLRAINIQHASEVCKINLSTAIKRLAVYEKLLADMFPPQ